MFKRKAYNQMLEWKSKYADHYACLLEGARRVGKTTIAEEFAKKEYKSYIKVDFADATEDMLDIFKDISKLDLFFLRLQAETGVTLVEGKSVIIFDEIQLFPKARQAIKYLVKDGRYHYIETGSLISIKKNVKDILIPSEEHKIKVVPMDYEEFLWAIGKKAEILKELCKRKDSVGNATNRSLMRDFRLYMAVGGMPQAVEAFIQKNNFEAVDLVKRKILDLYLDDLKKIDSSGRLSDIFKSVPSQLALKKKRFVITAATGKAKTSKDDERIFDLVDSRIVLPCHHVTKPCVPLLQTRESENFKLYLTDTGLLTTMLFDEGKGVVADIYKKMLSDKLDADLGYLYENVVAQLISSSGRDLFFHTWRKKDSTHSYEIDFLIASGKKVIPIEVKSSSKKNHESINAFAVKYSRTVGRRILFSQNDFGHENMLELKPLYSLAFCMQDV